MAVANSGNRARYQQWDQNPIFSEEIPYPQEWASLSDEDLAMRVGQESLKGKPSKVAVEIVCYLMKRHKSAIVLISRRYTLSSEDFEDFVQDLYVKLLHVLPRQNSIQKFGGLLAMMIHNMHKDAIRKKRPQIGLDGVPPQPGIDFSKRVVDLKLDYPLERDRIIALVEKKILSQREGLAAILLLKGYKPREMLEVFSDEELGIKNVDPTLTQEMQLKNRLSKIYSAIERARNKLRKYFNR